MLYDPDHGFYGAGRGRAGRTGGDFLTSPEVGPLFGAVLARALDGWWEELGRPRPFVVADAGAGPGTLARAVLAAAPRCAPALDYVAVERCPGRSAALHPASVRSEPALPARSHVVVANELLDNLPFRLVARHGRRVAGGAGRRRGRGVRPAGRRRPAPGADGTGGRPGAPRRRRRIVAGRGPPPRRPGAGRGLRIDHRRPRPPPVAHVGAHPSRPRPRRPSPRRSRCSGRDLRGALRPAAGHRSGGPPRPTRLRRFGIEAWWRRADGAGWRARPAATSPPSPPAPASERPRPSSTPPASAPSSSSSGPPPDAPRPSEPGLESPIVSATAAGEVSDRSATGGWRPDRAPTTAAERSERGSWAVRATGPAGQTRRERSEDRGLSGDRTRRGAPAGRRDAQPQPTDNGGRRTTNTPDRSFGSNHVDLGGIVRPGIGLGHQLRHGRGMERHRQPVALGGQPGQTGQVAAAAGHEVEPRVGAGVARRRPAVRAGPGRRPPRRARPAGRAAAPRTRRPGTSPTTATGRPRPAAAGPVRPSRRPASAARPVDQLGGRQRPAGRPPPGGRGAGAAGRPVTSPARKAASPVRTVAATRWWPSTM